MLLFALNYFLKNRPGLSEIEFGVNQALELAVSRFILQSAVNGSCNEFSQIGHH